MSNVHLVWGSTGEYSDHCTWVVAAFTSEQRATTFCARANAWLKKHKAHQDQPEAHQTYYNAPDLTQRNPYDPDMRLDYTGTAYSVGAARHNPPLPVRAQGA